MLRFEYPNHLYFFLVLILLILVHYYSVYRRKHKLNKFGEKALVKDLLIDVSTWKSEVKFLLCMLALSMFIIAYARPQFGTKIDKRERMGIEAIIAIDVSNSMYAEDVKPNRLEKAKMMMSNMVDGMKDDKVGLIVFAGQAFTQIPITSDYVSAKMFLETISPSMISVQGTDIAEAIRLACKSFTQQEGVAKAIFLITDGEDNEGGAIEAAKTAAEAGIRVYILGIGDPMGAPIPIPGSNQYIIDDEGNTVVSKLNEDMCREIARAGKGSYIFVDNSSSAQKKLSEQIEKLAKSKIESQIYSEYDEQFQGFVILGIIFLILEVLFLDRASHRKLFSNLLRKRDYVK
ncbi:MAG: VWA domain-containing protein [Bacteroidaceae bacterium]|nr:VWA domain-containing protein [Bacteroidaceae bacterium]